MKILFVSRFLPFTGGRETFLKNLIDHLKHEHKILLLTPDGLIGEGFEMKKYPEDEQDLYNIITDFDPDVINSHTHYLTPAVSKIAKKLHIPCILTLHGDIFTIGSVGDQNNFRKTLDLITALVVVSKNGRNSVLSNTSFNKNKTFIIHNGINNELFAKDFLSLPPAKNYLRELYAMPKDKFIFITPTRMIWYKGLDFLLDTILENKSKLKKSNALFLISTPSTRFKEEEFEYMDKILNLVNSNNINDLVKISFSSYEFMPLLYRLSDGFILPSSSEQFPISILEAMASEIPVIASNVGGVPEIVKHNDTGYLVNYEDKSSLYKSIETVLGEPTHTTTKAKKLVLENLNISKATKEYLKIFERSLGEKVK